MNRYLSDVRGALKRAGIIRSSGSWVTHFAIGAGVGLVAGAALAVLMTPQSGAETRRQIGRGAKDLAGRTSGLLGAAKGNLRARAARLEATGKDAMRGGDAPMG
jgi:gas vesicle protein